MRGEIRTSERMIYLASKPVSELAFDITRGAVKQD